MPTSSFWTALGESAKLHWRYFIFAWLFPVVVYATFVVMSSLGVVSARASVWFFIMIVAVLLLFGWLAITPYRRRSITAMQAIIWIVVTPILIFLALDALPFKWTLTMEIPISSNNRYCRGTLCDPRRESIVGSIDADSATSATHFNADRTLDGIQVINGKASVLSSIVACPFLFT